MAAIQMYNGPDEQMASTAADLDFIQAVMYPTALDFFVGYVPMTKLALDYGAPLAAFYSDVFDTVIATTPFGVAIQSTKVAAVCRRR